MHGSRRTTLALLALAVVATVFAMRGGEPAPEATRGRPAAPDEVEPKLVGVDLTASEDGAVPASDEEATEPETAPAPTLRVRILAANDDRSGEGARVNVQFADGSCRQATTGPECEVVFDPAVPGSVHLWAEASGMRRAIEHRQIGIEGEAYVQLELSIGTRIEGRVVDAITGGGIEGAVVGVSRLMPGWWRGHLGPGGAITDASGRFEAWWVFERHWRFPADPVVAALAPGYAVGLSSFAKPPDSADRVNLEFRLQPGGTVRGTVVRPDASAANEARVIVLPQADTWVHPPLPVHFRIEIEWLYGASVDGEGRYEVWGLPLGGTYSAFAEAEGYTRSAVARDLQPTTLRSELEVDMALRAAARTRVRVLDPDGDPAMDASVWCVDDWDLGGTTDEDGYVGPWVLDPGPHVVRVECKGYPPISRKIVLLPGKLNPIEIGLESGVSVAGILVDAAGHPVASSEVEAWSLDGGVQSSAWTDEKGRFRLDTLRPERYRLGCGHAGLQSGERVVTAPAEGLRLVLAPHGWLRVRLLAPPETELPRQLTVHYREGKTSRARTAGCSLTSANELIYVCSVPAGRNTFRIQPPKYAPIMVELDVPAGERALEVEIPLGPGHALEGRVVDTTGRPVPGARIQVVDRQGLEQRADDDGRFRISRLAAEPVTLYVQAKGHVAVELDHAVQAESPLLVVVLPRGGLLRGRVVDATGEGVACADVSLRNTAEPRSRDFAVSTDALGAFRMRIAAGCYVVGVSGGGAFIPRTEVTIETGSDIEIELRAHDR